jgi:hypothetical protein
MELLGDKGHVESRIGPFGDDVSVGVRQVHNLRQTYHSLKNHFGHTRWYSKVMKLKWKQFSVCLEIMLILWQDRCVVSAKHTIGTKIILDAPDGSTM